MVAPRRRLPGLRPQLRRQRRRRHRRPARHHLAPALPARPRCRRPVDHALLHLAAARPRVRRRRLHRRRPAVRHARRRRRADRPGPRARPAGHRRPGAQPHLRRARVVPGGAGRRSGQPGAGALHVPRGLRPRRVAPAQQLGVRLRRPGLDPRDSRDSAPVVPPPLRLHPARPRLAQPRGRRHVRGRAPLLARQGRGRLPRRRRPRPLQGGVAARPGRRARRATRPPVPGQHRPLDGLPRAQGRADVGPARGARRLPPLAATSSTASATTGWPSPRRGPRPPSRWPPSSAPTSSTRRSTSPGCWPSGRPSPSARSSPTPSRPSPRSARPRRGC